MPVLDELLRPVFVIVIETLFQKHTLVRLCLRARNLLVAVGRLPSPPIVCIAVAVCGGHIG